MTKRRRFGARFKCSTVEQVSWPGVSCAQTARELGTRENLMTRWKWEAHSRGKVAFDETGTPYDEKRHSLFVEYC
jgi:transposase